MIQSKDFARIKYSPPQAFEPRGALQKILGLDSESYTSGEPFILGTSLGDILNPRRVPECFFIEKYEGSNFVTWNLKYDSGAVLYFLPRSVLYSLWSEGKTAFRRGGYLYRLQYVPHKLLRIYRGRSEIVNFWEISQFFRSSLDRAAQKYLGESKAKIQTKNFTPAYYNRFKKSVEKYCIRDAELTARLGSYLVGKLGEFGIVASSLYSSASVSFNFFASRGPMVSVWRYWTGDRNVLKMACDAYQGGKFEVTTRGRFRGGIEYDIASAYPHEIAGLVDISGARASYTAEYQPGAVYGFLDCVIDHADPSLHIPCGPMQGGVRIYPLGRFRLTITKNEYDYLLKIGVSVKILRGCWLFVKRKKYPYRKTVEYLYRIKSDMKKRDSMLYTITKVCLNGFYGKMAQSIEQPDGSIIVGRGWNPVYASVITANTRIAITRIQNLMRNSCLAVHTDSAILTREMPSKYIDGETMGTFGPVVEGDGVLVSCGMYQIGKECAFKGMKARPSETWETILEKNSRRKRISTRFVHVESWLEAMAKNHPVNRINVFTRPEKIIDLNGDTKRLWISRFKGEDFLTRSEVSSPKIFHEII